MKKHRTVSAQNSVERPEFVHKKVEWLYEHDMTIGDKKLKRLLSLPRETLIEDLHTVLQDTIDRHPYFLKLINEGKGEELHLNFTLHAIYLLGELRATESLPIVLETLKQKEEFIEIWFGDFITGYLWEPLYYMGNKRLDLLKEFVYSPDLYTYSRTEVCNCVMQVAHHQPERKEEVIAWFEELFTTVVQNDRKGIIENADFVGLAVSDAAELRDNSLLPVMKELFKSGYVDWLLYKSAEDIEKEVYSPPDPDDKLELKSIYDRYDEISTSWYGYTGEDEEEGAMSGDVDALFDSIAKNALENRMAREETERKQTPANPFPKTGRNDPCPCGSGKKYKKCCWAG